MACKFFFFLNNHKETSQKRSYVRLIYKRCSGQLQFVYNKKLSNSNILYTAIRSCHGKRKPQLACCGQHKNQGTVGEMQMERGLVYYKRKKE